MEAGETLLDVTTDKVDVEVPSPAAGRVERIVAAAGDTVAVGALLAELVPGGAAQPTGNGSADDGASAPPAPAGTAAAPAPPAAAEAPEPGPPVPPPAPAEAGDGTLLPIVLPDMESVTEGVVVEWRAAVGDAVAADQIVVEVSTDKVDLEVPAPAAGRLVSIAVEAGGTFTVGQPLGEIAAGAGAPAAAAAPSSGNGAGAPAAAEAPAPATRRPQRAGGRRRVAGDHAGRAAPGPGEGHRPGDRHRHRARGHHPQARRAGRGERARPGGRAPCARRPRRSARARRRRPCAVRPPRSPATWTRACRSPRPPASARSPWPSSTRSGARSTTELKAAGRSEKLSFTHLIAWAVVRAVAAQPSMSTGYAAGRRHAAQAGARRREPGPGRGRGAQGRQPLAAGARGARRRGRRLPRVPRRLRRPGGPHARRPGEAGRAARGDHQPHQPGRPRHRRVGAAADAGPGHDRRHRRHRLPGGLRVARAPRRCARWAWRRS